MDTPDVHLRTQHNPAMQQTQKYRVNIAVLYSRAAQGNGVIVHCEKAWQLLHPWLQPPHYLRSRAADIM